MCQGGYPRMCGNAVGLDTTHTMMQWITAQCSGNFPSSGQGVISEAEPKTGRHQKCSSFCYGSGEARFSRQKAPWCY